MQAGHAETIIAGQASDGVAYASYPLGADGNYAFWVRAARALRNAMDVHAMPGHCRWRGGAG